MALDDADEVEEDMEPEELAVVHDPDPSARAADGRTIALSPDKSDKAARFFGWLMAPLSPEEFVRDFYGQRPLLVSRGGCSYLDGWFSKKELDRQLRKCALRWTDDIDAALYTNGARKTLNGEGEATAAEAWTIYKDKGCSLRLSWPQKHSDTVWRMVSLLEEHFGCGGGANVYATPPGKQGFAPHWDDIDAFILQLEGAKRWRVYAPRSAAESRPRFSSPNLAPDELGPLIGEAVLEAGDVLYLPRGFVHQADTPSGAEESGSLHLTVSVGRQHTWHDLLEFGLRGALDAAAAENPDWRETLPPHFFDEVGVVNADDEGLEFQGFAGDDDSNQGGSEGSEGPGSSVASRRAAIGGRLRAMLHELVESLPLDAACDQFATQRFMYDRMAPWMPTADAARIPADPDTGVTLSSKVRLVTKRCARLAIEEGVAALYHCAGNGRMYRSVPEPQHIDFDIEAAPALEHLLTSYPKYVTVSKLPCDNDAQRLDIARALAEAKVVMVRSDTEGQSQGQGPGGAGGVKAA